MIRSVLHEETSYLFAVISSALDHRDFPKAKTLIEQRGEEYLQASVRGAHSALSAP